MYVDSIEDRLRDSAPRIQRRKTPNGKEYDAWFVGDLQVGQLGAVVQAGKRFEDPSQIDQLGVWEDVPKAGYDPHYFVKGLEEDGVWGALVQPSQGLFWYRMPAPEFLSAMCRIWNDWIAAFSQPYPTRLKGVGCLNVDDVSEAVRELDRCKRMGAVAVFIPVLPLPGRPYNDPIYDRLWWTAQDVGMPLLMHVGSPRAGAHPDFGLTPAINAGGRVNTDYQVRYSLTAMIFEGVFDRYPRLKVGSIEHETAWIPHWLTQMDLVFNERPLTHQRWMFRDALLPSDVWRRNLFASFMEDDIGIRLRDVIGVENLLWGNDFPHAESTWPRSQQFLDRIFQNVPDEERNKILRDNAVAMYGFEVP